MFDTAPRGAARLAIRQAGKAYEMLDEDGVVVATVPALVQAVRPIRGKDNGGNALRPGYERFVMKTDPYDPIQPEPGMRLEAFGKVYKVVAGSADIGAFRVHPLTEVRVA